MVYVSIYIMLGINFSLFMNNFFQLVHFIIVGVFGFNFLLFNSTLF